MKQAVLTKTNPFFLEEVIVAPVELLARDYQRRIALLRERMHDAGIDFAVIYGDREHFSNIEYFSGYDCRFEEGLLIIPAEGTPSILVGNEGMAYSYAIPYEINRVFYRNFSLQGQPRSAVEKLASILSDAGIGKSSKVGLCGFKYFLKEYVSTDPAHTYDIPQYILSELLEAADEANVCNFTETLTGLDGGIRLNVHTAKEIAKAEAAACRSAGVLLRMLKALRPGMTEYELGTLSGAGFAPWVMFPLTNFGEKSVSHGIESPHDDRTLTLGDACGLCYGIRGSLTARVAVAAYDQASMGRGLDRLLYSFYGKFFEAMGAWYEAVKAGVSGHDLHWAVHNIIGGPDYNVTLNAGHYTGMDEWVNALSFDGSRHTLPDGAYLQADIIASASGPVRTAICEDTIIVAGEALRQTLKTEYPETFARIMRRQDAMRKYLGIAVSDDVLPLSNMNGAMFPFMLNLGEMFALK